MARGRIAFGEALIQDTGELGSIPGSTYMTWGKCLNLSMPQSSSCKMGDNSLPYRGVVGMYILMYVKYSGTTIMNSTEKRIKNKYNKWNTTRVRESRI